ncbi:MAG: Gx transporter family protein [Clostridia bacterium]|nr:Gx transporter family protein [Clostridia bacterium]MDY4083568.1 Gx transporter family protein [Eubacteriales bacterium]
MRTNKTTYRIALVAILTAASLIVFVVENAFPPLILPGAKLGLANLFTLLALVILTPIDALFIFLIRAVLGNIITGNPSALLYSIPAGLIALAVSAILVRSCMDKLSIVSISVASAVIHNVVQNLVFCLTSGSTAVLSYTPYLAMLGVLSGVIVGLTAYFILRYLPKSIYEKAFELLNNKNDTSINNGGKTVESN